MKRRFAALLALLLTAVLLCSCGKLKRQIDTGSTPKVQSQKNASEGYGLTPQVKPNSNSTGNTKDTPDTKAETAVDSTNIQMQNLSDEMDKLDSIMNGLDDSIDISDTEKAINNLK